MIEEAFTEVAKKASTQIKEDEVIFRPDTVKKLDAGSKKQTQGGCGC